MMQWSAKCDAKDAAGKGCIVKGEGNDRSNWLRLLAMRPGFDDVHVDLCPFHAASFVAELTVEWKERR